MDSYTRDGHTFEVRDSGPSGGELVVLLHGFPETPSSWDGVVPALNGAGFRVLAPVGRGCSPRARPAKRSSYALSEFVDDVLALADEAGAARFHLVGHDTGGAVAWQLAATHPDRLRTLTVFSTPHPRAMLRAMWTTGQALRSWYMLLFQLPRLPEAVLVRGAKRTKRSLEQSGLPERYADEYVRALLEPGAATGALNWYRGLPFGTSSVAGPVAVPTLYVWSSGDRFLVEGAARGVARYVTAPYRFEVMDAVSHWIPEEVPDLAAELVLSHIVGPTDA